MKGGYLPVATKADHHSNETLDNHPDHCLIHNSSSGSSQCSHSASNRRGASLHLQACYAKVSTAISSRTPVFRQLTRSRVITLLVIVLLVACVFSLQCVSHRFSSICCQNSAAQPVLTDSIATHGRGGLNLSNSSQQNPSWAAPHSSIRREWQRQRLQAFAAGSVDDFAEDDGETPAGGGGGSKQRRRFPQAVIIGVRKGGTRALLEFLNLHPSIVAKKGEMHFFEDDESYALGLEWYRRQMPYTSPTQLTIEKTPAYFAEELVPARMHDMSAQVKLLLVLRDPTERAISDYTQILFNKRDKGQSFESFETLAITGDGVVNKSYKAIRRSMYCKHMERWLRWFPLHQFHFVDGTRLVTDPVSELAKVEQFLGLEQRLTQERFYYNSTRGFYCMRLERKEKCLAPSKGRVHPPVDAQVVSQLRRFFAPLNRKLYTLIGQSFDWPEE